MAHDGPWTDDQDTFIIAYRRGTILTWADIRCYFTARFTYEGENVKTEAKDIESRFNKKLKKESRVDALEEFLRTQEMEEEHGEFVEAAKRLIDENPTNVLRKWDAETRS